LIKKVVIKLYIGDMDLKSRAQASEVGGLAPLSAGPAPKHVTSLSCPIPRHSTKAT